MKNVIFRGLFLFFALIPLWAMAQNFIPSMQTAPKGYWCCDDLMVGERNNPNLTTLDEGLQYHLMAQSLAGLVNRAVDEGRIDVGIYFHDLEERSYQTQTRQMLAKQGVRLLGHIKTLDLLQRDTSLRKLLTGYVLTDVRNNPESGVVATVASHVFSALIVDERDRSFYENLGLNMVYDAREKTTEDAWREFRDKCQRNALVLMPVSMGELREFAIKNRTFVLNLNRIYQHPEKGQNLHLFKEVLAWLKPNAPILGWEHGVDECDFVQPVSRSGHVMIPCDWSYNHSLASLGGKIAKRKVTFERFDPRCLNEEQDKKYVSFFLTDGDNVQWMMGGFVDYMAQKASQEVKMTYGMALTPLADMSVPWTDYLVGALPNGCSAVEMLGGGYYYVDTYSQDGKRKQNLKVISRRVAREMKARQATLLSVMAIDVLSESAKEAYQAYIDANAHLEAILAFQYSPYAGGEGQILWLKNSKGYDIPIITAHYTLWNFGDENHLLEGTPRYIAECLTDDFSVVGVHAWSNFSRHSLTDDMLIENKGGTLHGAQAAKLCADHLSDEFCVVNFQELVWRLRMKHSPKQTQKYINKYY